MEQSGIGVILKRLFVRSEPTRPAAAVGEVPRDELPARRTGPSLVLLVPRVAGVSIYQIRPFDDAHSAAAFIEACDPYRVYKDGIIGFWALHERPPQSPDVECAVFARTELASDLVHAYVFADLEAAISYVRSRALEDCMSPGMFIVNWILSVRINANPTGEVQIQPALPPIPNRDMTSPATGVLAVPEDGAHSGERARPADPVSPPTPRAAEIGAPGVVEATSPVDHDSALASETRLPAQTEAYRSSEPRSRRFAARVKAHVLALGLMGFAPREIEAELRAMYPHDRLPAYATISGWLRRAGISRANLKRWEAMSEQAIRLLQQRIAELDEAPIEEVARVAALLDGLHRK